jgi:hypothetical protein
VQNKITPSSKMKTLFTIAFITIQGIAMAQTNMDSTYHAMKKVDLSKIYIEQVQRVTKSLSGIAFKDVDANVPKNKFTQSRFEVTNKKVDAYNEQLMKSMIDIIPYCDKEELIKAIIYLQSL